MAHPISDYRAREGLSKTALAKKLGVSHVAVLRWENGSRYPDRGLLPKITELTGIPARDLRPDWAEVLEGAA